MRLSFVRLVLGPLHNNVYLLADEDSRDAVVIDPSFKSDAVVDELEKQGWNLRQIWLTHGHFDHTTGVASLQKALTPPPLIGIHPTSYAWAQQETDVFKINMPVDPIPPIDIPFFHGQQLGLNPTGGTAVVEVREVPGHNPGSVMFYCELLGVAFVGDAIFRMSIGRTDLPGGDHALLLKSIREQIFTLPDNTTLLPGHGPESSVAFEKVNNPYLA